MRIGRKQFRIKGTIVFDRHAQDLFFQTMSCECVTGLVIGPLGSGVEFGVRLDHAVGHLLVGVERLRWGRTRGERGGVRGEARLGGIDATDGAVLIDQHVARLAA